jgi:hypothetical protein
MQRVLIATLMALFFGLFSMPALQAAPANGWLWSRRSRRCHRSIRFNIIDVGGDAGAVGSTATVRVGDGPAGDGTSVEYFVTGRRLQAGGSFAGPFQH